jgi:hypothetical protein
MSQLRELLFTIRQHPAFRELLDAVSKPKIRPFKPSDSAESVRQESEWIFESGRARQDELWRNYLIEGNPVWGSKPSDKEKL